MPVLNNIQGGKYAFLKIALLFHKKTKELRRTKS